MRRLVITADGSCLGNPGPGGWAWVYSATCWAAGGHQRTTNNLMELRAVHEIFKAVPPEIPLTIQTDSQYVVNVFTEWLADWEAAGWRTRGRKPVANRQAIEMIRDSLQKRDVSWVHVRGHSGHTENEMADTFARAAAEAIKRADPPATGPTGCLRDTLRDFTSH